MKGRILCSVASRKKKEPKPKLLGPDIFGWGGGLPREGVGAKKFGMSFETHGEENRPKMICFLRNAMTIIFCKCNFYHWGLYIGDKISTYRSFCLGELFSVIVTGNLTAYNSWGN